MIGEFHKDPAVIDPGLDGKRFRFGGDGAHGSIGGGKPALRG